MRPKGSPEELLHHRQRAIALLEQGLPKSEVARRIGVTRRSVRRWHRAWRRGGAAALAPKSAKGAPARLSRQQQDELAQALIKGAKAAGFDSELWTGRRIAELIQQRFGVAYNDHYVLEVLRGLKFTPQRPEPVAREKNPQAKAHWLRWLWPAIKKNAQRRGKWLVFIDETGLLLTPLVRATWAPRGQTPKLEQVMGQRRKISVIGALCVSTDLRRAWLYLGFFPEESVDGALMRRFLECLVRHLHGPVTLVWDALGAHLSEEVEEFLDEHPRLRTFLFPPYCPELNPVEWLWRWLKWDRLANFAPASLEALDEKAGLLCAQACADQALLRSFIAQSELPLALVGG